MFFKMYDCDSALNNVTEIMLYTDVMKTEISIEDQKNIINQAWCCEKMWQWHLQYSVLVSLNFMFIDIEISQLSAHITVVE